LIVFPSDQLGSFFEGNTMKQDEAIKKLSEIEQSYKKLPTPKYNKLSLIQWKEIYADLIALKPFVKEHIMLKKMFNAVSQFISKLEKLNRIQPIKRAKSKDDIKPDILMNTSERGVNKSIPCIRNKKDLPFQWMDEKNGIECTIKNGIWNAQNYMLIDILSYQLLMKIGGNIFPKDLDPLFKSGSEILNRESELDPTSGQNDIISTDRNMSLKIEMIKKTNCHIEFDDKNFRELTGKKMSSNAILDLIHRTSNVEFQLVFPVRMFDEEKAKEKLYKMNSFSRLFEFGYIDENVREFDGAVRNRVYYIAFNTMLGELLVHNLKTKNYDFIPRDFYSLPDSAQIFYRKFILNHDFPTMQISQEKIKKWLNLSDQNMVNLTNSIKRNVFEPLKSCNLIMDVQPDKGPNGIKYRVKISD